ncbi:MAG: site-2 protease family protein [Anaeromyxobacter sp.]
MLDTPITERVLWLVVFMLSCAVHEFAHAWAAWRLGDDTAARQGRLTLNPIAHADLIGTVILPLLMAPFAWAKPTPVNPARFRRGVSMATGDILVSVAGPISNVILGLVASLLYGLLSRVAPAAVANGAGLGELLLTLIVANAMLAVFNLLPVPPLDGGHVVGNLIPERWRGAWNTFATFAPFVLMALVITGASFLRGPIIGLAALLRGASLMLFGA